MKRVTVTQTQINTGSYNTHNGMQIIEKQVEKWHETFYTVFIKDNLGQKYNSHLYKLHLNHVIGPLSFCTTNAYHNRFNFHLKYTYLLADFIIR